MKTHSSRVRLVDVARLAGVSTTTASRALNGRGELSDDTRATVLEAANRLGFRPSPFAQSLRTHSSHTIGLIVPHVAHPFYASIVQGVQTYLSEAGYRLILMDSGEESGSVAEAIDTLLDHWVDGIMISTTPLSAAGFAELLHGTPCIFIDETIDGVGAGSVTLENQAGIEMLVGHLVGHGHKAISLLVGPADRTDGRERREGFLSAMAARTLKVPPGMVRDCEWNPRSAATQTLALLDSDSPPTAIVAASVELALGCLVAARSRGLSLPADLALVSFDDPYFAPLLEPALTTISYDTADIGARSAALLLEAIETETPTDRRVRVGVHLVTRRSCGCEFNMMEALNGLAPV